MEGLSPPPGQCYTGQERTIIGILISENWPSFVTSVADSPVDTIHIIILG